MKVAISCDYLIKREHYIEIIESVLAVYPDATIYSLVFKPGAILGRIEQRKIVSSSLSKEINSEEEYLNKSFKLSLISKNIKIDEDVDLLINISRGLSSNFIVSKKTSVLTYVYDLKINSMKSDLFQKLFSGFIKKTFIKSLRRSDYLWISNTDLLEELSTFKAKIKIVPPPFKFSDYAKFPKEMFKHDFYLVSTCGLTADDISSLINFFDREKRRVQFIGVDSHLQGIKEHYKSRPELFFGERCAGEHAPVLASSKMFISFSKNDFPKLVLACLAVGRPVLILDEQKRWIDGSGVFTIDHFNLDELKSALETIDLKIDDLVSEELRDKARLYNESIFKNRLTKLIIERV